MFVERYDTECGPSARQAWNQTGYILKNPVACGSRPPPGRAERDGQLPGPRGSRRALPGSRASGPLVGAGGPDAR